MFIIILESKSNKKYYNPYLEVPPVATVPFLVEEVAMTVSSLLLFRLLWIWGISSRNVRNRYPKSKPASITKNI